METRNVAFVSCAEKKDELDVGHHLGERPLSTLREHLQNELVKRYRKNPRYSLRAFAKSLEVEPSALSKILRGKRRLTPAMQSRLGHRLGLGPQQMKQLLEKQNAEALASSSFESLSCDAFQTIADWYHYAILELTRVNTFKSDVRWISRALGISVNETNAALERLERLQMIERDEQGNIKPTQTNHTIAEPGESYRTSAARLFQKQVLQKALDAIDVVPLELRENSGVTMAINMEKFPEAEAMVRKFRRSLMELLESGDSKEEVYQLVVALFPLTQKTQMLPHHSPDTSGNKKRSA